MTRVMLDAYTPSDIPTNIVGPTTMLAAYINGVNTSNNFTEMRARFPYNQILTISTNGDPNAKADIADCENGDYTPASAATWAHNMVSQTTTPDLPTIYVGREQYSDVVAELIALGLHFGSSVDLFLTTLDGSIPSGYPGLVAVQYTQINGGKIDVSTVLDNRWHALPVNIQITERDEYVNQLVQATNPATGKTAQYAIRATDVRYAPDQVCSNWAYQNLDNKGTGPLPAVPWEVILWWNNDTVPTGAP